MANPAYIPLSDIIKELSLQEAYMPCEPSDIHIISKDINRVGLELIGSLDNFDKNKILVSGQSERSFLSKLSSDEIVKAIESLFCLKPPVVIIARGITPAPEIFKSAEKFSIPILTTPEKTSELTSHLMEYLSLRLAPKISRPGVLLNVHGEGILLIGKSGIGKSETAVELLNRGHRLIADDEVVIRKVSKNSLIGSSPENLRHFLEVRGIGIINARRIFGIGAVKLSEKIDMVINLESWDDKKNYDRLGTDNNYTEILGIKVPFITIPVRTGRNLAVIIEVAAMNNRQKKLGYNAARELFISLGMEYPVSQPEMEKCIWDI